MLPLTLALLAASAIAAPTTPTRRWWNEDSSSLAAQAIAAGKTYFGDAWQSFYRENQNFSRILEAQFNQYTFENEMKWQGRDGREDADPAGEVIEPERGVYNWTGADLIVAEAKRTNSILRGHNFCWDSQTPTYVTNITDPDELKQVLQEHINAVLGRYASDLYAFDVVNEPLNENGTYKSNVWYDVLGESYIATALEYTRAAAPDLKLYINDYNIEGVNNKSMAMAEVARGLLAQGAPLDGIGFESHFIGGSTPPDIAQSMKMFTDQGLDVAITELDVRVPINNFGYAVNQTWYQVQADDYANVTQVCLDNDKCVGITVWSFSDDRSWIPGVFAGMGAADLYDLYYQPKPALGAVQGVLAGGK